MEGEVLQAPRGAAVGTIAGEDGQRYAYGAADVAGDAPPRAGAKVDFRGEAGVAREVFAVAPAAAAAATPGGYAAPVSKVPPGHPSMRHKLGNPIAYFKKCMTLYADGKGRAGVAEYWSFALVTGLLQLIALVFIFADPGIRGAGEPGALFLIGIVYYLVVALGLFVPAITVGVRRLHDLGMSGWLYLLVLVPYLGGLFIFVCSLIPSSASENEHGPSPKADPGDVFA